METLHELEFFWHDTRLLYTLVVCIRKLRGPSIQNVIAYEIFLPSKLG